MAEPVRRRYDAPARRRGALPRVTWVLAVSAFLAGALVSAALFSVGWRHEAQRGTSAQAALAAATARTHALTGSLADARGAARRASADAARARRAQASAEAAARTLAQRAHALAGAVTSTGRSADSVTAGAASVGASVDTISNELKTLGGYLTSTPAAQLDPGYVATQTQYLSKQLDRLAAARSDLDAAVQGFSGAAHTLADRAAALSGRN
jgi:uncharacterized protein YoxC